MQTSNTSDDQTTNGEKSNPIGKLQELTQKNWIRPPEYEFSDQENASTPNSKMYSCHAKVASYTAEGIYIYLFIINRGQKFIGLFI